MSKVKFTRHARSKFEILKEHGFEVSLEQVENALLEADVVISQEKDRFIAQKAISDRHVLRVVYRQEGEEKIVITFYPGRKDRYES